MHKSDAVLKKTVFSQLLYIFIVKSSALRANLSFEFVFQNWNYMLVIVFLKAAEFSRSKMFNWELQLNVY